MTDTFTDNITLDPEFLWLPKPTGELGSLAGKVGNFMPYCNIKFADLPLFHIPNEHLIDMSLGLGIGSGGGVGGTTINLTLLDPTNFILERVMRYAIMRNNYGGWAFLLVQFGWTDGITNYGMQPDEFLKFSVSNWVQTVDTGVTRYTLTGVSQGQMLLRNVRVPDTIALPFVDSVPVSGKAYKTQTGYVLDEMLNRLIPNLPNKVKVIGNISDRGIADIAGFFNQAGNQRGITLFKELANKYLTTTSGGYFQWCFVSHVNEKSAVKDAKSSDEVTAPVNNGVYILFYDPSYVDDLRKQNAIVRNSSMPSEYSIYKSCEALIRWPNHMGYALELQIGGNTDWLGNAFDLTRTSITAAGQVSPGPTVKTKTPTNESVIQDGALNTIDRSHNADQMGGGAGQTTTGKASNMGTINAAKGQRSQAFANQMTLTTKGEPWFVNQAMFAGMHFGVLFDNKTNLSRVMVPYAANDPDQLKNSIPMLRSLTPENFQFLMDGGFFDPEQFPSPLTGTWAIQGVTQRISGGTFTTSFQLLRDLEQETSI